MRLQPGTKRLIRKAMTIVVLLLLAACAFEEVKDLLPFGHDDTAGADGEAGGVAYEVTFNVPADDGLKQQIEASSRLLSLKSSPPASMAALKRRANDDAARFERVLRSRGYYDSDITTEVAGDAPPYQVTVTIAPGDRFTLAAFDIAYAGGPPEHEAARANLGDLGIALGAPAVADAVVAGEARLLRWLANHGYPFATLDDRLVLLDIVDRTLWVQVTVKSGPLVRFGDLQISGLQRSRPVLVERAVDWRPGDIYDQREVDATVVRLGGTGVFSSVAIEPAGGAEDAAGERAMDVVVAEGPPRSISVGLGYESDLGPEVQFGWEHRNIFGEAERLSVRTTLGMQRQRVDTTLTKPDFLQRDQNLIVSGNLVNERFDAYDETGIETSALLERKLSENWIASAGVAGELFRISDDIGPDRSLLFGLPLRAVYDNSDNLLNPTEGYRLTLLTTPWAGQADTAVQFLTTSAIASAYRPLDADRRVVVAVRGEVGTIIGADLAELPANQRFYAGGGGSVRGYEYQKAGPLNRNNDPTGGKSLIAVSGELRLMVTEQFGVVPFIDGGTVYPDARPDFGDEFFWGAGLGLRYLTAVGPVRFDVAVPLDRRPNIDDSYQFYISLGQAF